MQEGMSLMYSWDPRVRRWVKEPSRQDAPPPPAEPVDNEAVQTFYFDPQDERWIATILGDVGRRIANELGDRYRGPAVTELAMRQEAPRRRVVPTPDQIRRIPRLAWLLGVLIAAGVAAWAAWAPLPPAPPLPLP